MILDTLQNIRQYKGLSPAMDQAIEALATLDFAAMEAGDYPLGTEGMHYMVQDVTLKSFADSRWECHNKFIDIQYACSGGPETICYAPRDTVRDWVWDPNGGDIAQSDDPDPGVPMTIPQGSFGIYFPQDAHRPGQGDGSVPYRKVVFKIPVSGGVR